ncbi:MAG: hypothetical protein ABIP64_07325 [Burkholderiales bacterium]
MARLASILFGVAALAAVQVSAAVEVNVVGFDIRARLHSKLCYLPPHAYELKWQTTNLARGPKLLDHYIIG